MKGEKVSIWLTDGKGERLTKLAKKQNRTRNNVINIACDEHLAREEKKGKGK